MGLFCGKKGGALLRGQVKFDCAAEGVAMTRPADPGLSRAYGRRWPQGVDLRMFPFDTQFCGEDTPA